MMYEVHRLPLFPAVPAPLDEQHQPPRLLAALGRWISRAAMHRDDTAVLSRHTGGRV